MRLPSRKQWVWGLLAGALALRADKAGAQAETKWLTLKPTTLFLEMDSDWESVTETVGNTHYSFERLYLAPTLGLVTGGSIYHPNLLQFDFKGQGGYILQDLSSRSSGPAVTENETMYLQNYDLKMLLLGTKPYASGFTATRTHTFEELDTFNQAIVDAQTYAGHTGFTEGPVPVVVAIRDLKETESGIQYDSIYSQLDGSLNAQNYRTNGNSTLSFNLGQYDQNTSGFTQNETYAYGNVVDSEQFGRLVRLNSSLAFNQESVDSAPPETTRNIILQENLVLHHAPGWESYYNFDYYNSYFSPSESITESGSIGIRNQLFESLSSAVDVHGSLQSAEAPGASLGATSFGFGWSETYTKHLGDWGRLTIGNNIRYDITDEQNTGTETPVLGEQHTLTDGVPTFLNLPLVLSVDRVTDPTGVHVYLRGIDYTWFQVGELARLERVPTSLALTNGAPVIVNYTVQSQPSGAYDTFNEGFQIRLDLFHGMVSVYSQIGSVQNASTADFVLENTVNTLSGIDFTWHWFKAGGSYETQDGNLVSYAAWSAYQMAAFRPGPATTCSINARQRWARYLDENLSVDDYTVTGRFSEQVGPRLNFSAEAGVWNEQGGPLAQTLYTAGLRASYNRGKLWVSGAYQFNHQDTLSGSNLRNFVSLTLRRDF